MKAALERYAVLADALPPKGPARDMFERLCADVDACTGRIKRLEDTLDRFRRHETTPTGLRDSLADTRELNRLLSECRQQLRSVVAANVELVKAERDGDEGDRRRTLGRGVAP